MARFVDPPGADSGRDQRRSDALSRMGGDNLPLEPEVEGGGAAFNRKG